MSGRARGLHPLRLTVTAKPLVFGGQAIARRLGKRGLPDWSIAETWECSDVTGAVGVVVGGRRPDGHCARSPPPTGKN